MSRTVVTTTNPHEVEHLRDRVRLYLQVMLIIDIGARVSDVVSPLFIDGLTMPDYPPHVVFLRWTVTIVLAAGWLFTRFAKPNRPTLIALESGVTLGLAWVYVHLASAHVSGVNHAGFIRELIGGVTPLLLEPHDGDGTPPRTRPVERGRAAQVDDCCCTTRPR